MIYKLLLKRCRYERRVQFVTAYASNRKKCRGKPLSDTQDSQQLQPVGSWWAL